MNETRLNKFGSFIVKNLFDSGLNRFFSLTKGELKAPSVQNLQSELSRINRKDLVTIEKAIIKSFISATHDFLFALQENSDMEGDVAIYVDGKDIAKESDGLHGEIFLEEGWLARFSKFSDKIGY